MSSEAVPVVSTIDALRDWRRQPGSVGFVPTMGFLHDGHLSLIRQARRDCDRVVVSIFVNPAQFDRAEDLELYPRDLAGDLEQVRRAGGDLVFTPDPPTLYPPGFDTWVIPGEVAASHEGRQRPGHFRGVATVVLKLLNIVNPDRAYFGQKDAQQLAVVRRLVRDLDLPVEIVAGATVREADGLAMSSRNVRLDAADRTAATVLHRALCTATQAHRDGERDAGALCDLVRRAVAEEPRATLEYVSVADSDSFRELDAVNTEAVISLAARFGAVRLIDNLPLAGNPSVRD